MNDSAISHSQEGDPREVAVSVVAEMLGQGRSLNACLDEHTVRLAVGRDRAFARELCYGVARWLLRLGIKKSWCARYFFWGSIN